MLGTKRVSLFDTDLKCRLNIANDGCNAYEALTGETRSGKQALCSPCIWNAKLERNNFWNKFSHLTVSIERFKAPLDQTCAATIIRADFMESDNSILNEITRDRQLAANTYAGTGDDLCESKPEGSSLGLKLFLCASSPVGSTHVKPLFFDDLCTVSNAVVQSNGGDVDLQYLDDDANYIGFGKLSINRSVFIGILLPLTALLFAAIFIWFYRVKCLPTQPSYNHNGSSNEPYNNGTVEGSQAARLNNRRSPRGHGVVATTTTVVTNTGALGPRVDYGSAAHNDQQQVEALLTEDRPPPSYEECIRLTTATDDHDQMAMLAEQQKQVASSDSTTPSAPATENNAQK